MKNAAAWKQSKYELHGNRMRGSRDHTQLRVSSRIIADRVGAFYAAAVKEHARGDLLDLGCGKTPLYLVYRDRVDTVTCADWPSSPHDVSHADVLCDLNEPIPSGSDSCDTVILSDVLEHLHQPAAVLKEINRLLRPGGVLLLNVPFLYWLHEEPHDYYRYTRHALQQLLTDAGPEVRELKETGGGPDVVCDLVPKLFCRGVLLRSIFACFIGVWQALRRVPAIRRWADLYAKIMPLGYFVVAAPSIDAGRSASYVERSR